MENATVSPLFNDPNCDVSFISSDNVTFKVYKKYLEFASSGFPVADSVDDDAEPVPLTETGEVLEVLFQFIHPPLESRGGRQPSVLEMESPLFFAVAQAAEKYVVFSPMNTFVTRMDLEFAKRCPIETLNHAYQYGYNNLADKAAEEALVSPLLELSQSLNCDIFPDFIKYRHQWQKLADFIHQQFETYLNSGSKTCFRMSAFQLSYTLDYKADIRKASSLPAPDTTLPCPWNGEDCGCSQQLNWLPLLNEKMLSMQKFSQVAA